MLRTIAKLYAYKKSPRATFLLLHPFRTLRILRSGIVALPVGIWLGKKMAEGSKAERSTTK